MGREIPEHITYAQKRLLELVQQRKLREWCLKNELSHNAIYQIAMGIQNAGYKAICSLAHLIPPVEFFYFTDETMPYEPKTVPKWDKERISFFVSKHRFDYLDAARKYGLPESSAYKIFVQHSCSPTPQFIRSCCIDTDPIEFFIEGTETDIPKSRKDILPDRGDIVNFESSLFFVVSKKTFNAKSNVILCCPVVASCEKGIELKKTRTEGFVNPNEIVSIRLQERRILPFISETADKETAGKVMDCVRKIFE